MVMRNGNSSFDLDYNLYIQCMPQKYWDDYKLLKDTIMDFLNQCVKTFDFSDGKDSTSVITANLRDDKGVFFKVDIAILLRNRNNNWCRLIHDKNNWRGRFYLTEVPNSKDVTKKARKIKQKGLWDDVREEYKKLKNMYLFQGDRNHPSYVCYVEAVNAVWYRNDMKQIW